MKLRVNKVLVLLALLPILPIIAGCPDNNGGGGGGTSSPSPKPTPSPILKNLKDQETTKLDDVMKSFRGVNRLTKSVPDTLPISSADQIRIAVWQAQIVNDVPQMPDPEVTAAYSLLITAIDTQSNAQLATTLTKLTVSPRALNVFLYRLTPTMRQELWSRLSITKINALSTYLSQEDGDTLARYLRDLSYLSLAPASSVPWNRI